MVGNSNDDTKFPHKLLLTNTQVSRLHEPFANSSSTNTKFSETQLSKVIQSEGFIELMDKIFGPAMRVTLEVPGIILLDAGYNLVNIKIDIKPSILSRGSGITLTNNEIKDNAKISRSFENRGILLKGTTRKIIIQKGGFLKPLMITTLTLMKNVFTPFAKNVLVALGLTAAGSATDTSIQKKIFVSGMTALIISDKEIDDIIKIVKSREESG